MVSLLMFVVTGIVRSPHFGSRVVSVLDGPTVSTAPIKGSGGLIGVDRAVACASRAGLGGPLRITMATSHGRPYTVAERTVRWPIRADEVTVDPYTGRIADRVRFADTPLVSKVLKLGVLAHSGRLFGPVNQAVELLRMLGTVPLIGFGYRMWWQRGPRRGPPARRAILRTIPWPGRLVVLGSVSAVRRLLPAFGISLALFVVVEAAVNWAKEAPA
ncbi:PepSY-associated TM region [Actinokineospora alba]|uniref:PepSY-associated TM region n=2 Tax=Actinokineospora alba TaxID=504798 RepID=A0A1H0FTI9_9PSEU|nr:PepSY-associated TM region [Actinokineospora alba]SDN97904.1 PepSY-associated TM region [Actinokineospora alba]